DQTHGDATAGDNVFSFQATVVAATTAGVKTLPFSTTDNQTRTGCGSISLTVTAPMMASATAPVTSDEPSQPAEDASEPQAAAADKQQMLAPETVGGGNDFAIVRYKADGTLDPGFGAGGKVTTDFAGGSDQAFALVIQTGGKVVAAGTAANGATGT